MPVDVLRRAIARCLVPTAVGLLLACGGDSNKTVSLSWSANRESGVNKAGGGYEVAITGQPKIDVPYASGSAAPTTTTAKLPSGTYTVTVRAYATLDPQGGSTKTFSSPSQAITVNVP